MRTAYAGRVLAHAAQAHRADGLPQLAVFAFDHVGRQVELWGRYEREELELLMQCLQPFIDRQGIALDVGANIGNHALFLANHFTEVFAFEPNPRVHALLTLNATLCANVRCFPTALSDRAGSATLAVPPGNLGMASLEPGTPGPGVTVALQRLDDLSELAGHRVALIKLDVEGHEPAVLRGARALLARDRPVVVFEQSAQSLQSGTSMTQSVLRECGYARWWTIEHHPESGSRWGDLVRRLLFGESLRMMEVSTLAPRFHSMVVALPAAQ